MNMRPFPIKRFFVSMAVATPVVIAVSLVGQLMDWSYGVSFFALALVGTIASMAALDENPLAWLHPPSRKRQPRHPA
jgi:hypothetical protein